MEKHGARTGGKFPPEYCAWHDAKQHCTNPNNSHYKYYGERGIKFLFISFQQFLLEVGPKPKGYVLDRIDNEGNYEPGNVRWVTRSMSNRNRRGERGMLKKHHGWKLVNGKWAAKININGKPKHLGCFNTQQEASEAYTKALQRHITP